MTVEDLIEKLRELPPTAVVFVESYGDQELLVDARYELGSAILDTEFAKVDVDGGEHLPEE